MFKPQISILDAIKIAISYSRIELDDPYCVSAIYEDTIIALVINTLYQRYEFYVDSCSGEVLGIMSEPADYSEIIESALCA